MAEGRAFDTIDGLSFRNGSGGISHNRASAVLEDMDQLPFVTDVYKRDLKVEDYFIGYLKHPYVSLYTGRGCRSKCTFCLWPQTVGGHRYRVRSEERALSLPRMPLLLLGSREALSLAVYLGACFGRTVWWRGQRFRVRRDGSLEKA